MNQTDVIPAPQITPVVVPNSKWEQERRAFAELLPELLSTHRDNFVAIHGGAVVGSGDDRTEVAMAA
jgi:nicotinamide riboside kinase